MICEVCQWIDKICPRCEKKETSKRCWESITVKEKVDVMAYKRLILSDRKASKDLINAVSNIYAKYPDFDLSIVP